MAPQNETSSAVAAATLEALPRYVEWQQERFPKPPFTLGMSNNRRFFESHGFRIRVDRPEALTTLCDHYLNDPLQRGPGNRKFEPVSDSLLVTVNRYSHTGPPPDDTNNSGVPSIPYLEFCFVVLVRDLDGPQPQSPSWFMPVVYIAPFLPSEGDTSFVQTGADASIIPTLTGREVYGFPKGPAHIRYDVAGSDVAHAQLQTLVPIASGELDYKPVFEIRKGACNQPGAAPNGAPDLVSVQDILGPFLDEPTWSLSPSTNDMVASLSDGRELKFDPTKYLAAPLLALKQSRHPKFVDKACYQAVVSTPLVAVNGDLAIRVEAPHCIEFFDPAGQGLWSGLGLDSSPKTVEPLDGYHLNTWLVFADPNGVIVLEAP